MISEGKTYWSEDDYNKYNGQGEDNEDEKKSKNDNSSNFIKIEFNKNELNELKKEAEKQNLSITELIKSKIFRKSGK